MSLAYQQRSTSMFTALVFYYLALFSQRNIQKDRDLTRHGPSLNKHYQGPKPTPTRQWTWSSSDGCRVYFPQSMSSSRDFVYGLHCRFLSHGESLGELLWFIVAVCVQPGLFNYEQQSSCFSIKQSPKRGGLGSLPVDPVAVCLQSTEQQDDELPHHTLK